MTHATKHERDAAADPLARADVDIDDTNARKRWADVLGVTEEALVGAVQVVGTRVDRIKEYLGAGGMAADQIGG